MSRTIRNFPRCPFRSPRLIGEVKLSYGAVEALEEELFVPSNRVKVKGNYKFTGDDFPMYAWDQLPKCLR